MNLFFFTDTFTLEIREAKIHSNKIFLWPCFCAFAVEDVGINMSINSAENMTRFMAASCVYVYHIYCIKNYKICLELMS